MIDLPDFDLFLQLNKNNSELINKIDFDIYNLLRSSPKLLLEEKLKNKLKEIIKDENEMYDEDYDQDLTEYINNILENSIFEYEQLFGYPHFNQGTIFKKMKIKINK